MGLLNSMTPEDEGILQLGLGLLGSRGNFASSLAQGGEKGLAAFNQAKQVQMAKQLQDAQLQNLQAEGALHGLQADRMRRINAMIEQSLGGGPSNVSLAFNGGVNSSVPNGGAPGSSGGMFAGLPADAVASDLAFNDGKGIANEMFQRTRPNKQNVNGTIVDFTDTPSGTALPQTNQQGFSTITVKDPTDPSGYRVVPVGGSNDVFGTQQGITERAKANFGSPVTINGRMMTPAQASDSLSVGSSPTPNRIPPVIQSARDDDAIRVMLQERGNALLRGDTNEVASLDREIASMKNRSAPVTQASDGLPGVAVQPNKVKAIEDSTKGINDEWIQGTFKPIRAAGESAQGRIEQANIARAALSKGLGGWGDQTKASMANVLSGLGLASDKVKDYAADAQIFQKVAMERLWSTLNDAAGPQTEGDAGRASKTYASLSNTPKANAFILDLAQAQAERDKLRANFYTHAQPIAKSSGDLTEVDREWQARTPSIFDMPSMKAWKAMKP